MSLRKFEMFFDLIFLDRQLNVDAGEREVRPPGAPTSELIGRRGFKSGACNRLYWAFQWAAA